MPRALSRLSSFHVLMIVHSSLRSLISLRIGFATLWTTRGIRLFVNRLALNNSLQRLLERMQTAVQGCNVWSVAGLEAHVPKMVPPTLTPRCRRARIQWASCHGSGLARRQAHAAATQIGSTENARRVRNTLYPSLHTHRVPEKGGARERMNNPSYLSTSLHTPTSPLPTRPCSPSPRA
jgi:predicted small integral membrane protein